MKHLAVITPVCDRREWLVRAGRSIADQRNHDTKIVWYLQVDHEDPIPANLLAELDSLGLDIRTEHHGFNAGQSAARNRALQRVLHQNPQSWVTPLDSDDTLPADALQKRQSVLGDVGPTKAFLITGGRQVDEHGEALPDLDPPTQQDADTLVWEPREIAQRFAHERHISVLGNSLTAPARMIARAGGWPAVLCGEDLVLVANLARQDQMITSSERTYNLTMRSDSTSSSDAYITAFANLRPQWVTHDNMWGVPLDQPHYGDGERKPEHIPSEGDITPEFDD